MFCISELNRIKNREEHARALVKAFRAFNTVALEAGVLSAQAKQLISVAAAPTMQCVIAYRIGVYTGVTRNCGNTEKRLTETVTVATAMCANTTNTHATNLMRNSPSN